MRIRAWLAAFALVAVVGPAWAAAGPEGGSVGQTLAMVAMLLVAAKLGGLVAEHWGQPAVLGELLVGVALGYLLPLAVGPGSAKVMREDPVLGFLAEVGVLILLFDVGLESDLRALGRVGPSALLVALIGVVAPMALGAGATLWLLPDAPMLVHLFVGATLAATSVGITARVLRDLRAVQSPEGQTILGAAVIDDVLGLVVLAVIVGAITAAAGAGPGLSAGRIAMIVLSAALFLAACAAAGHFLAHRIVRTIARLGRPEVLLTVGLSLCFALAFAAEAIGLAGIVGAFAAGFVIDPYGERVQAGDEEATTLNALLHPISAVFVPLFFVMMGMRVDLASLASLPAAALGLALIVAAIAGKVACGLGVVSRGVDRLTVAIGMVPRGEVGLIFAAIGASLRLDGRPVLAEATFAAVVIMVLVTTVIAPPALRWRLAGRAAGAGSR